MSIPDGIPSFGPSVVPRYARIPFAFSYFRDDQVETQQFNLLDKKMDMGSATRMMRLQGDDTGRVVPDIIAIIAKHLDDKDGTPAAWKPIQVPAKKDDPDVIRFRGPDGKLYPMEKAPVFLDLARGSSRKRWLHLMNVDEDAAVEDTSLVKLVEFVTEVAAKHPTHASS